MHSFVPSLRIPTTPVPLRMLPTGACETIDIPEERRAVCSCTELEFVAVCSP